MTLEGETHFERSDTVYVEVTAGDGLDISTPLTSDTVTILNTAPSAPEVSISPTVPAAGSEDLRCTVDTASFDPDSDTLEYVFTWTVDGSAADVATSTTYSDDTIPGHETRAEESWTCTVIVSDGETSSEAATASVVPEWKYLGWGDEPFLLDDARLNCWNGGHREPAQCSRMWAISTEMASMIP